MSIHSIGFLFVACISILEVAPQKTEWCDSKQNVRTPTKFVYMRPSGAEWARESEIHLDRSEGLLLTSVTTRTALSLKLIARYDRENRLLNATVATERDGMKQTVQVTVSGELAQVLRHGGQSSDLDCPQGVIVTSAPDWTDTFLMLQRYDRGKGAEQEFAGLWVHPTQEPQRPTFKVARLGTDSVERDGKKTTLDRFRVILRGGTRYTGWADSDGIMIKLVTEGARSGGIVLQGWEQAMRDLP